jgi:hypothetical protein
LFHRRDFKERNEPLRLLKTTRGRRLISSTEASLRPELKIRSKLVGLLNKRVARIGVPALRAVTQSERIGAVQRVISGVCVYVRNVARPADGSHQTKATPTNKRVGRHVCCRRVKARSCRRSR